MPGDGDRGHAVLPDEPGVFREQRQAERIAELAAALGIQHFDNGARAYAEVLAAQPWHWFLTLTFRPDHERASGGMHPEKADKAFRVLLSKINRECYGVRWYKRPDGGLMWARGQEFHKSGRIHFHALAAAPTDDLNRLTRRMAWVDWWWREFGIARIESPQSQADVNAYVSKYVTKDGEVDFSPNFGRYVPPALLYGNAPPPRVTSSTGHPPQSLKRTEGDRETEAREAFRCLTLSERLQRPLLNSTHLPIETDQEADHE